MTLIEKTRRRIRRFQNRWRLARWGVMGLENLVSYMRELIPRVRNQIRKGAHNAR